MDPAAVGRKIKQSYPMYSNIPDELLGAKIIQKFPSMATSPTSYAAQEAKDLQTLKENQPANPNQYLETSSSTPSRPPLESFVIKEETKFADGKSAFGTKAEPKKEKKGIIESIGNFIAPRLTQKYKALFDLPKKKKELEAIKDPVKRQEAAIKYVNSLQVGAKDKAEALSLIIPAGKGVKALVATGAVIGGLRGAAEGEDYDVKKIVGGATGGAIAGGVLAGAGKLLQGVFKNVPKRIMNSLLKEPIKATRAGIKKGTTLGEEALAKGEVGTTTGIYKKAVDRMAQLEDELQNSLIGSKNKVSTTSIRKALDPFLDELNQSGNTSASKTILDRLIAIEKEVGTKIPVSRANAIKRTLYDEIMKKYGEQGSAGTELTKQLARAFKDEIGTVPGVSQINKDLSYYGRVAKALLDKMTKDERRQAIGLTDVIIGTGGAASGFGAPAAAVVGAKKILSSTPVKTGIAQGLYKMGNFGDRINKYLEEPIKKGVQFAGASIGKMFVSPSISSTKQSINTNGNQEPKPDHTINNTPQAKESQIFEQPSLTGHTPEELNTAYQKATQAGDKATADYFQDQFKKEVAFRKAQALPPTIKQKVMDAEAADKLLTTLQGIYEDIPSELKASGPDFQRLQGVRGSIAAFRQSDKNAANYKKQQKAFLSLLTRAAGEKGVLTNQDVARIKQALPGFYDSPDVAEQAWGTIRTIITSAVTNTVIPYSTAVPDLQFAE